MIVLLCIILYIGIGAALGCLYSYLRFKESGYFDDDEATLYCALCTFLFPIVAPVIFSVYLADHFASDTRK